MCVCARAGASRDIITEINNGTGKIIRTRSSVCIEKRSCVGGGLKQCKVREVESAKGGKQNDSGYIVIMIIMPPNIIIIIVNIGGRRKVQQHFPALRFLVFPARE